MTSAFDNNLKKSLSAGTTTVTAPTDLPQRLQHERQRVRTQRIIVGSVTTLAVVGALTASFITLTPKDQRVHVADATATSTPSTPTPSNDVPAIHVKNDTGRSVYDDAVHAVLPVHGTSWYVSERVTQFKTKVAAERCNTPVPQHVLTDSFGSRGNGLIDLTTLRKIGYSTPGGDDSPVKELTPAQRDCQQKVWQEFQEPQLDRETIHSWEMFKRSLRSREDVLAAQQEPAACLASAVGIPVNLSVTGDLGSTVDFDYKVNRTWHQYLGAQGVPNNVPEEKERAVGKKFGAHFASCSEGYYKFLNTVLLPERTKALSGYEQQLADYATALTQAGYVPEPRRE